MTENILRQMLDAHPPGKRFRQLLGIEHRDMRQGTGGKKAPHSSGKSVACRSATTLS